MYHMYACFAAIHTNDQRKKYCNDSATPTSRDDFLKESQLFSIPLGGLITAALRHTSNVK